MFASRWKALWWSAGVLMLAYCTVPAPDEAGGQSADKAEVAHASLWDAERK